MATVLAKFKCVKVSEVEGGAKYVSLQATTGNAGDNKDFTEYTPSGTIEIMIAAGAPAANHFKPGKKYFVSFDEDGYEENAPKSLHDFTENPH